MSKYLYNPTSAALTYVGLEVPAEGYLQIPYNLESKFANASALLIDIANDIVLVSKLEDAAGHITDVNTAIGFLKDALPRDVSISTIQAGQLPFASKVLPNGKKLYRRIHGVSAVVAGAADNINFSVPYESCKITGIEIIGCEKGDRVNFKIFDTPAGTISGVPNLLLNQFGFNVALPDAYYENVSPYDADLIEDLVIRLEYDAINTDLLPKTVYVNFTLHEVTD